MDIEWINKRYKEANRIFDSAREVEEWVDGNLIYKIWVTAME